ncbi:gastrula zinc finger protein XlCGF26.1-like [Homalodisca vitripennis]|uniref:gastrula zinc finger protein XlCGF26.1-like n=1 Tax=Homalodisca vitripennis TaxID=197043 RepID=UPI001EE9B9D0|nr:gastrula zinc finger protein XlCGF26.1-like [Homalodisca vitripennis]
MILNFDGTVMDLEGNPRFLCGLCGRHYKYKADRDRHQRQECGNERQFACTVCPYRARQKRTLKTHMVLPAGGGTILDPEGNLRFGCPVCGRLYKYRRDLGRHRRYECGIEPQFPCSACPYRAKQKGTLKTHMALKHNINGAGARFNCDMCGRVYKHRKDMLRHVRYECLQDGCIAQKFECMRCGKVYKFKRILNRHLRYECGLEPQFACPHCPYKGKRNTSLQSHMMLKHQIFIPLTHEIKVGALQQSRQDWNVAAKYVCTQCGRNYKFRNILNRHLQYECGKEPQFACPHCPYKAKQKSTLKTHMTLKHKNALSLLKGVQFCLNCGRKYSSLRSLVRHQRYECGKLPQFACPLCSYKAHQKVSLKKHIASRHTQQWFGLQSSGALEILGDSKLLT